MRPIFDAHLHYNDDAREPFPLASVLALFREHGVRTILATSRPNDGTRALVDAANARRRARRASWRSSARTATTPTAARGSAIPRSTR
jgi:hypothetical protein